LNGFAGLSPKLASKEEFHMVTVGKREFSVGLIGICLPENVEISLI
jgi:hypothetical protein